MKKIPHTIITASTLLLPALGFAFQYGDPSADEQAHIEAINRARLNPLAEAERLGFDLFEGTIDGAISGDPVQPLSSNAQLLQAARNHSEDMIINDFFAHNGSDGQTPFDRMQANGYTFDTAGENIAFRGTTGVISESEVALQLHDDLFIDEGYPDRGHRVNILDPDFREVGAGLAFGEFISNGTVFNSGMITTDFGRQQNSLPILLGVVYDDQDNDRFYDAGEGISGVSVEITETRASTTTASAGGYGIELSPNHQYTVSFLHPDFGSVTKTVQISQLNVKLDVLLSEFNNSLPPESASQCATLIENQLEIPCIRVSDKVFSAQLAITATNPIQFTLTEVQTTQFSKINPAQCANFDVQTTLAQLPCVQFDHDSYSVDLQLISTVPHVFKLKDFNLN